MDSTTRNNKQAWQPEFINRLIKLLPYLISAIAIAIYFNALSGKFVIDDVTYFVENDLLTQLSPFDLKSIFLYPSNYWGELLPMRDLLYVIEYNLFGEDTTGYHLVSLMLYIASAFVLYFWIKELINDFSSQKKNKFSPHISRLSAGIVMSLFLLNPLYVEAVAYISGQKDILSIFFVLLSMLFLYRYGRKQCKSVWILPLGIIFHYMAVLSKLSALSTLLFIPALWIISSNKTRSEIYKMQGIWVLLNIPVALWLSYVFKVAEPFSLTDVSTDLLNRIPRAISIIGNYISHITVPWPLSFGYPFNPEWSLDLYFFIGIAFCVLSAYLIYKNRSPLISIGLLIFIIYLLPVLQVFPEMPNSKVFDRYLGIPLIGIFLVLERTIYILTGEWKRMQVFAVAILLSTCIIWTAITVSYIPKFNDNVTSTEHLYRLYPEWNATAFNLADSLIEDSQLDRAEKFIYSEKSLNKPDWVKEYFLGRIYLKRGDLDKASNFLMSSLLKTRNGGYYPFADIYLAEIMIKKGNTHTARRILNQLLNHKLKNPLITFRAQKYLKEINSGIN